MFGIGKSGILSNKLELRQRPEREDNGIFACLPISQGEFLAAWGGYILEKNEFTELSPLTRIYGLQVEEHLFLVPETIDAADYINHSCNPNAGLSGQIVLIALRDINPNEEICYDYAMSDGCNYDEFDCFCGSESCRGRITGNDWCIPDLWNKYNRYFSPYIQRRIDDIQKTK